MRDLSILIPARNEMFLTNTIQDALAHMEADTEIIAVLDGQWPVEPIPDHPKVIIIHMSESIGQRAATNMAARIATGKYLMKADAHCAFEQGFDVKLLHDMQDDWTTVPTMRNLHVFDWVCECGHRRYQGPTKPCEKCGKEMQREMMWIPKTNPQSTSYRFDHTLHFQYWAEYKKNQTGNLVETLSLQGSCFMCTREKYFELNICDETWGSWGNQGTEVAIKTWLSGGKVIVNKNTYYAHMFRTQGGDFGFPYPLSGRAVERARQHSRDMFFENKFDKQVYPLSWLLDKFKPVPDWHDGIGKKALEDVMKAGEEFYKNRKNFKIVDVAVKTQAPNVVNVPLEELYPEIKIIPSDILTQPKPVEAPSEDKTERTSTWQVPKTGPTKGILYYFNNRLNMRLAKLVRSHIANSGLPITSVTLKPTPFGRNIAIEGESSPVTMFRQILTGLEAMDEDIIFLVEADVLYHPQHFQFTPSKTDVFYYNGNYWFLRIKDGFAVHYDSSTLSSLVAYREPLFVHFRERMELLEKDGFSLHIGYEPMTHGRIKWKNWYNYEVFMPEFPNVDIAHSGNMTWKRWSQDKFRKKPKNWTESTDYTVPGWNLKKELKNIDLEKV